MAASSSGLVRFIPACAGNSPSGLRAFLPRPVHPRVRGEQGRSRSRIRWACGSSPRARGTGIGGPLQPAPPRFIPACAGNRIAGSGAVAQPTVHPRVRGEQISTAARMACQFGSSPRARGPVHHPLLHRTQHRFIPACAGNSFAPAGVRRAFPVHPRVRGEQIVSKVRALLGDGSSPRARGTAIVRRPGCLEARFIPACAGNSPRPC